MNSVVGEIKQAIEEELNQGHKRIIIYPFGEIGMTVKYILNHAYAIKEKMILDNHLYMYNDEIKPLEYLKEIDGEYSVFLASTNIEIYESLKKELIMYVPEEKIVELARMKVEMSIERKAARDIENQINNINNIRIKKEESNLNTTIGKYSYGPLAEKKHYLIESIGSFCSFAEGVSVVENHATEYITTHPMIYEAGENDPVKIADYEDYRLEKWFFPGVKPRGICKKRKKTKIGNDVWLGKNVTITNGSNIGNGVIAGAGSIITKDIPDYAIVVGVPARIIRYRYNKEQIAALNRICWWNWSDDLIRDRFEDFYLDIDMFIDKYDKN